MRSLWLGLVLLFGLTSTSSAHKASDAYLQLDATATGLSVRWDIALRDLDAAIDLDADGDGRLSWGEVKAAWPRIEAYAMPRLRIAGCALSATPLAPVVAGEPTRLEHRNDGVYAVLWLTSTCVLKAEPVISYTLLREVDPTHRGIVKLQLPGQPVLLRVLDPARAGGAASASTTAAAASGAAGAGGDSAEATQLAQASSGPEADPFVFLREGIHHILTGYDHILFLLCLLLPSVMRRTPQGWRPVERLSQAVWPAAGIVTAFTLAHSLTLALAGLKLVSLPSSFIEPAIAVTIIIAAVDNFWPIFRGHRAWVTFAFGLIHGFGFAGVLGELNLPTLQFIWALLQFNVGLELGQLSTVFVTIGLLYAARRLAGYSRWVIQGGSTVAIVVAGAWFIERTANVSLLAF
jgi:hypothetical protein